MLFRRRPGTGIKGSTNDGGDPRAFLTFQHLILYLKLSSRNVIDTRYRVDRGFINTKPDAGCSELQRVGTAPAADHEHLAHSTPERNRFTATDFNSYVTVTIADGAPKRENGRMKASTEPGLGTTPIADVLGDPVAAFSRARRPGIIGAAAPVGRNSYSLSCHEGRMAPVPEVVLGPAVENTSTVTCAEVNGKNVSRFARRRTEGP